MRCATDSDDRPIVLVAIRYANGFKNARFEGKGATFVGKDANFFGKVAKKSGKVANFFGNLATSGAKKVAMWRP